MFILAELPSPRISCIGTIAVRETDDTAHLISAHEISSSLIERYFSTCNRDMLCLGKAYSSLGQIKSNLPY